VVPSGPMGEIIYMRGDLRNEGGKGVPSQRRPPTTEGGAWCSYGEANVKEKGMTSLSFEGVDQSVWGSRTT